MMPELGEFEKILGYKFKNISYLKNALTHTSYINEHKNLPHGSNERMEFLGDSVLGLSVSEFLYKNYKKRSEGELSKIRASVVCEDSLAKLASSLHLGEYLLMGKGESLSGGGLKPSLTSDAMESVIAAIYLDSGFDTVKKMVLDWLKDDIIEAAEHRGREADYKSVLQEYCQSRGYVPVYTMMSESGPDHNKTFETKVEIAGGKSAFGVGSNKKKSQQMAAKAMLDELNVKI
ncbi:MAG: ribonuclease III [Ruminococcaceae bacterium]|nr:ribonuclease III [Oscillospiraceae bacterium]